MPLDTFDEHELFLLVRLENRRARRTRALFTLILGACLWSGVIAHDDRSAAPSPCAPDR